MLTKDEVKHIAKLSALNLKAKEEEKFSDQLSEILNYVEKLDKINTQKIEPLFQVTDLKNVSRDDSVVPSEVTKEEILEAASARRGDFIGAEKIFDRE